MKRFLRKQLPAVLLVLAMMVSLMPAAMAGDWSVGDPGDCTHPNATFTVSPGRFDSQRGSWG